MLTREENEEIRMEHQKKRDGIEGLMLIRGTREEMKK